MKKDCSNIFVFKKEWERRREAEPEENWTPITKLGFWFIDEEDVKELQKWSDEHSVLTRREKFLQMFPNADMVEINPCTLNTDLLSEKRCAHSDLGVCVTCHREFWDEEVEE